MSIKKCKICENEFYTKPSHLKMGWGLFCSSKCKHIGMMERTSVSCFICNKLVHKTPSQMRRSKSGKHFCGKSCQTKWRNVEYGGHRHPGWKGGQSLYRKIMLKSNRLAICVMCNKKDVRILAVHHVDGDHSNLNLENLAWLCHNCHYLVHHDKLEKLKFIGLL